MEVLLDAIKLACLFIGILFTSVNIIRTCSRNDVSSTNFLIQAAGVTGFIYLQWLMK